MTQVRFVPTVKSGALLCSEKVSHNCSWRVQFSHKDIGVHVCTQSDWCKLIATVFPYPFGLGTDSRDNTPLSLLLTDVKTEVYR